MSTHHIATASSSRLVALVLLGPLTDFANSLERVQRAFLCINVQEILHGPANLSAHVHALRAVPLQVVTVLVVIIVPLAHFASDIL